jgi:hypothetical protein
VRNYAGVLIPHRLRVHLWKLGEGFLVWMWRGMCDHVRQLFSTFVMLVSLALVAITLGLGEVDHSTRMLIHNFLLTSPFLFPPENFHCFPSFSFIRDRVIIALADGPR